MDAPAYRIGTNYQATTPVAQFRELVATVDDLVYDMLTVADQAVRRNVYAWSAIAAEGTERVKVGPCVTNPYSRNPGLTAASIATIDEIAAGRSILGMGIGGHGVGPFGYEQHRPIGAMRDAIDVIRRLLAGEIVSEEYPEFLLDEAALEFDPVRREIPVYVGGRGPQLLALGGAVADGVFAGEGLTSTEGMDYAYERIKVGADTTDRDPDEVEIRCVLSVSIADDHDVAVEPLLRHVAGRVRDQANPTALIAAGASENVIERLSEFDVEAATLEALREAVPTSLLDQFAVAGTVEECRERVEQLFDQGITTLHVIPRDNAQNNRVEILTQFSNEVVDSIVG